MALSSTLSPTTPRSSAAYSSSAMAMCLSSSARRLCSTQPKPTPSYSLLRLQLLTRHHAHHYLGFAEDINGGSLDQETPRRLKPLLYVLRVAPHRHPPMRTGEVEANLATCSTTRHSGCHMSTQSNDQKTAHKRADNPQRRARATSTRPSLCDYAAELERARDRQHPPRRAEAARRALGGKLVKVKA